MLHDYSGIVLGLCSGRFVKVGHVRVGEGVGAGTATRVAHYGAVAGDVACNGGGDNMAIISLEPTILDHGRMHKRETGQFLIPLVETRLADTATLRVLL